MKVLPQTGVTQKEIIEVAMVDALRVERSVDEVVME
jgi:hypothetical protein